MTVAVLDTNVVVQAVIGSARSASARVIAACLNGHCRLAYSLEIVEEWLTVFALPSIRERHGLSDNDIVELVTGLLLNADCQRGDQRLPHALTRDVTDTKFLAVALEAHADYLVTNDRRHLHRIGRIGRTRVVTPGEFLRQTS